MPSETATIDVEAERIVKEIGIPPCPAILTRLIREMREDDPDFARIAKLIGGDVGLAASILMTVNSPFFGLRSKATSVQQAIALMGLKNVTQLVTGLLLRQAFATDDSEAMERFWETSSGVALICAQVARGIKGVDRDEAYTFALFRDCGVPLMMKKFPDYVALMNDTASQRETSIIELELLRYNIDHARVGAQLARSWHLSEEVSAAILNHNAFGLYDGSDAEFPAPSGKLAAMALVAEEVFMRCDCEGHSVDWGRGGAAAMTALGLSDDDIEGFEGEAEEALKKR